jgi:hypothetical protein
MPLRLLTSFVTFGLTGLPEAEIKRCGSRSPGAVKTLRGMR